MEATNFYDVLKGRYAVGASPEVGRLFLVCKECRKVVPMWRCVATKENRLKRMGCKCGHQYVRPAHIPEWQAALWVVVVGLFWRRLIWQRKDDWDARIPWRKK
jgi:hypothetical protein